MSEIMSAMFRVCSSKHTWSKMKIRQSHLLEFGRLSYSSQELLLHVFTLVRIRSLDLDSLWVDLKYDKSLFAHKKNFYRCRSELVSSGFLIEASGRYLVNPIKVHYLTSSEVAYFRKLCSPESTSEDVNRNSAGRFVAP